MAASGGGNAELMQTLDDAWNGQDADVFRARHKPDVVVSWPGQPEPTRGSRTTPRSRSGFGTRSPTNTRQPALPDLPRGR
jgi:hypothetical protein